MHHPSDHPEAPVQDRAAITTWLDHLRVLLPPRHVLLVGAGAGTSPWVQWLRDVKLPATLVEADEAKAARLQQATEGHTGWQVRAALVGTDAETATFHVASMASESGLLEPETLRTVWPNLRTRHTQPRKTVALAKLLLDEAHPANWLLLDCLPPVPLLQSARSALSGVDLLLVRSLLRAQAADEAHADEEALQALLGAEGFRRVAVQPGRHPALGHLLWVRDPATTERIKPEELAALREQVDQLTRALDASSTRESAWVVERQALLARAAEAAEAKAAVAQLTTERQRNAAQILELQRAMAAAEAKGADAENKAQAVQQALADARLQVDQLSAERQRNAAQIKLLHEAAAQSDQTLRVMNERQQHEAATAAQVEKLQGELADTRATIEQLTTERQRNAAQILQLQRAATAAEAKTADLAQQAEATQRALTDAHAGLEQQAAERQRNAAQIKLLQDALAQSEAKVGALQAEVTQLSDAAHAQEQDQSAELNAQLARLTANFAELQASSRSAQDGLSTLLQEQRRHSAEQIAKLVQAKDAAEQKAQAHSQDLRDVMTRLAALQEASGGTDKTLQALHETLRSQQASVAKLGTDLPAHLHTLVQTTLPALDQSLKTLGTETTKQSAEAEARLRNDLKKGLANAVKQMESFIGIQNYLATGDLIAEFHGWPISPDIGLFLLEKVRQKNYDLIIEFGSGTSTVLFARALQLANASQPITDAPQRRRVISFEHDVRYFERTASMLTAARVSDMVDLVHAPLVTWSDGGQPQLFYDCAATLDGIAESLVGRTASILVLVDGPPGATGPNARYPSAPVVFEKLGRHQIDLALDDADRPDEKAVMGLWKEFWKVRGYQVTLETHSAEKGLVFATSLAAGMK